MRRLAEIRDSSSAREGKARGAGLRIGALGLVLGLGTMLGLLAQAEAAPAAGQAPSGEEILRRVDENQGSDNKIIVSEMVIHGRRGNRSVRSKSWIRGRTESFSEYLDPPRERGTKMLKLEDLLWLYTPGSDRTILISGHMLRQSVMGSDLSYEDLMEDARLVVLYDAAVAGEELMGDRPAFVVDLAAKAGRDVAYARRKIWVDRERFVVLREDRFAKGGTLLKTTEVKNVSRRGGRWVPDVVVFKDALKEGEGTEFRIESIEFDAAIPESLFSKASLKK